MSLKAQLLIMLSAESEQSSWIQLLPLGDVVTADSRKLKFSLTKAGAEKIIAEFNAKKNDMVVDYEHQSMNGVQAPAAGWIKKLEFRKGGGLFAFVEWTDKAWGYITEKEYRYISPVLSVDKKTKQVTELLNAAVTNQPAIDGMKPILAKVHEDKREVSMRETLIKLLGLADDATDEQITDAVKQLQEGKESAAALSAKIKDALKLSAGSTESVILGTVKGLSENNGNYAALSAKVAEMEARQKKEKAERAVDEAISAGKILPAQKEYHLKAAMDDPEAFSAFAATLTPAVNTGKVAPQEQAGKKSDELSEETIALGATFGLTKEDFEKFGPVKTEA